MKQWFKKTKNYLNNEDRISKLLFISVLVLTISLAGHFSARATQQAGYGYGYGPGYGYGYGYWTEATPTLALSYLQGTNASGPFMAGTLTITATFGSAPSGTPDINIDLATGTDVAYTAMTGSGTTWTYAYTVASGVNTDVTVNIRTLGGAGYTPTPSGNNFTIDTTAPSAPTASLATGVYVGAQSVTLSGDAGTTIYYTTDGTAPTNASAQYATAITISSNTTLKAIAYDTAGNASPVASRTYTIATGAGGAPAGGPPAVVEPTPTVTPPTEVPPVVIPPAEVPTPGVTAAPTTVAAPEIGGTIGTPDAIIVVVVPPAATEVGVNLQVGELPTQYVDAVAVDKSVSYGIFGKAYQLVTHHAATNVRSATGKLLKPVEIKLAFDEKFCRDHYIDLRRIVMTRYDKVARKWIPVKSTIGSPFVKAQVREVGIYALQIARDVNKWSGDGNFLVALPKGSAPKGTSIVSVMLPSKYVARSNPEMRGPFGQAYNLITVGTKGHNNRGALPKVINLSLKYDTDFVTSHSIDTARLVLSHYSPVDKKWFSVKNTKITQSAGLIEAKVNELGVYALMIAKTAPR